MGKVIGIFGGTFDPIHLGHLNLAIEILEKKPLDEVWFCPARSSPFKREGESTAAHHRLKMIDLAIAPIPAFRSVDIELQREGPSYTIDTLRYFVEQEKSNPSPTTFSLIMGEDTFFNFFNWRHPEEIMRLAPLTIGCRQYNLAGKEDPVIEQALKGCLSTRIMEISGTEIRERLKKGLYCGHLVPKEVLDYIREFHLY